MALINNVAISAPQVQASTCILLLLVDHKQRGTGESQLNDLSCPLLLKREKCIIVLNSRLVCLGFFSPPHTLSPPTPSLYSRGRECTKIYLFGNISADTGVRVQCCIGSVNSNSFGHTCL